jgi:GNAT superfamily N-acetyltransferase
MTALSIRPAAPSDASDLAELVTELGYPATATAMERRIARLAGLSDQITLVACDGTRVVGVGGALVHDGFVRDARVARLTGLVVREASRGRGAGRLLMQHLEQWARARGADEVTLASRMHRKGAHAFYLHLGYEQTGIRFGKALADPA